ncbi:MAG: hypothetical protein P1V51_22935 [Deltaproteobacteria bacterium]|nr:hypothetical protein [Deltaproteobacteria bacterium]
MRTSIALLLAGLPLFLLAACGPRPGPEPPGPTWTPEEVYRAEGDAGAAAGRGLQDARGIIHGHSPYSHDACDGEPRDPVTDAIDEACLDDLRRAICQTRHDFVMLSDHGESFARSEFPDVLLHRPAEGDTLVDRGSGPVANRIVCGDESTLVLAGTETGAMPVALEGHVDPDPAERARIYGSTEPADLMRLKAAGAVVLAQHTEDWSEDDLALKPFDGFEMYNLHANLFLNAGPALELILLAQDPENFELLPHPEVVLALLFSEDPRYLDRWSGVLARGVQRVTTLATDAHRNSLPDLLQDGERMDSFRRMMRMFSNHLLIEPGTGGGFDDRQLRDALRAGRLYGSFDYLGFPRGFDFHAREAGVVREMGASVVVGSELVVEPPRIQNLDPEAAEPELTLRLLRATAGGWVEVASAPATGGTLRHTPSEPGAYRAEVRIRPFHLRGYLGDYEHLLDEQDFVWIYANPIYLEP